MKYLGIIYKTLNFRCDQCRDLIWGLYDTGAMKCANCNLTCHDKCKSRVQLNCTAFERPKSPLGSHSSSSSSSEENLSTLAGISTLVDEEAGNQSDDDGTLKSIGNCLKADYFF